MTETQIELAVERKMDSLDRQFMAGSLSEDKYNREIAKLDKWAKREYRKAQK